MTKETIILYVDDEIINLQVFEINFSRKYTIHTAISGEEALKILDSNPHINIVISDMNMPKMNGIQFIKTAKSKYKNLHYFILTGYEITQEIKNAIASGIIVKYFSKPFDMEELNNTIDHVNN